ncbi:hypothetical protein E2C01_047851 [Portunus trituberculatus]|uniref:Uncharacterized protein n=1 Tax=Portunus trituberculatus TaxID=210409 RepID=A0A5B7G9Y7_PORTR|nr:hypothetical protein [Portunus trituberculatus]
MGCLPTYLPTYLLACLPAFLLLIQREASAQRKARGPRDDRDFQASNNPGKQMTRDDYAMEEKF